MGENKLFHRPIAIDDAERLRELSAAIRAWEPSLELVRPEREALLYEPDGTLYAVCLSEAAVYRTHWRESLLGRGDLIVVPKALAVDAGSEVDLIGFRHDGQAPDHFRERFIQVWGFEHLQVPSGTVEMRLADVRHRVPYAVVDVSEAKGCVSRVSGDLTVLVGLEGFVSIEFAEDGDRGGYALLPGFVMGLVAGRTWEIGGTGRVGILRVVDEISHQARRLEHQEGEGLSISSEYGVDPPS